MLPWLPFLVKLLIPREIKQPGQRRQHSSRFARKKKQNKKRCVPTGGAAVSQHPFLNLIAGCTVFIQEQSGRESPFVRRVSKCTFVLWWSWLQFPFVYPNFYFKKRRRESFALHLLTLTSEFEALGQDLRADASFFTAYIHHTVRELVLQKFKWHM